MINKDSAISCVEFSAGMNKYLSPFLLKPNAATYIENANISTGKLVPLKKDKFIDYLNAVKFVYFDNTYLTFGKGTYIDKWINRLYTSMGDIYLDKDTILNTKVDIPTLDYADSYKEVGFEYAIVYDNNTDSDGGESRTKWLPFDDDYQLPDGTLLKYKDVIPLFMQFVTKDVEIGIEDDTGSVSITQRLNGDEDNIYFLLRANYRKVVNGNITTEYKIFKLNKSYEFTKDKLLDDYDDINDLPEKVEILNGEPSAKITETFKAKYVVTLYNEQFGFETIPSNSIIFNEVTNNKLKINVDYYARDNFKLRIYKLTSDGLTNYTLIDTIDINDLEVEYMDTSVSILIAGNHILDSWDNYPIPDNIKHTAMYKGIRIAISSNKLYYSKIGFPEYFPQDNVILFEEELEGIGIIQSGIIVFSKYKSWIIAGDNETNFFVYPLSYEVGCINRDSIAYYNNQLLWLAYDGIYTTSGGTIQNISKNHLGYDFKISDDITSCVWNEQLFLSGIDDKTLIIDFRFDIAFYYLDTKYAHLDIVENKLKGTILDGDLVEVNLNEQGDIVSSNISLVGIFEDAENRELHYISPKFMLPTQILIPKYSKNFILISDKNSDLKITLNIDDIISFIEYTDKTLNDFDNFDIIRYKINKKQFRFIQIEIKSKGTVYEYIID